MVNLVRGIQREFGSLRQCAHQAAFVRDESMKSDDVIKDLKLRYKGYLSKVREELEFVWAEYLRVDKKLRDATNKSELKKTMHELQLTNEAICDRNKCLQDALQSLTLSHHLLGLLLGEVGVLPIEDVPESLVQAMTIMNGRGWDQEDSPFYACYVEVRDWYQAILEKKEPALPKHLRSVVPESRADLAYRWYENPRLSMSLENIKERTKIIKRWAREARQAEEKAKEAKKAKALSKAKAKAPSNAEKRFDASSFADPTPRSAGIHIGEPRFEAVELSSDSSEVSDEATRAMAEAEFAFRELDAFEPDDFLPGGASTSRARRDGASGSGTR